MREIIDQGILLVYSFITVLLLPVNTQFIVAVLAVIVYVSVNNIGDLKKVHITATALLIVVVYFCPVIWLFLPVILYSILKHRTYLFAGMIAALGIVRGMPEESVPILGIMILGCVLAGVMQYRTGEYEELERRFKRTRDDGTERNLLLKEKNKSLIEKQDYEVYTATLKERNRIAREIHDNVGHMLSRSILMVGAMKVIQEDEKLVKPLEQLEETLNAAMTSVRKSVHDLHDESLNLREVLDELVAGFTFCTVNMDYDMEYDVPREIKYTFIAIVKEALSNVIKHSNATSVHIVVREHPGIYQMIVEDNGSTFKTKEQLEDSGGIGILNMKDRVQMLQGTIQIGHDRGFRIFITVPKGERTV